MGATLRLCGGSLRIRSVNVRSPTLLRMTASYVFEGELFRWAARREKWLFVSLPEDVSAEIAEFPAPPRGFASLRVDVTLGASTWTTSIFPGGDGRYTMPVKRSVYERQGVDEGDTVQVSVRLLDVG